MMKRISIGLLYISVCLLGLMACNSTNTFTIGDELITSNMNIQVTDTCTIHYSTVLLDSVPTSGTGVSLVGNYKDPEGNLGIIKSSAFLMFQTVGFQSFAADAAFDSVTLDLYRSHYYYGDTTLPANIEVHKLNQRLDQVYNGISSRFNVTNINYDAKNILGKKTFSAGPSRTDIINIDLDKTFGNDLFNMVKNGNINVTNYENFLDYVLKGVVLISGSGMSPVLGFPVNDSIPRIRLHYHLTGSNTYEKIDFNVGTANATYAFNHFDADRSNGTLADLQTKKQLFSGPNDKVYTQAGTGVVAKLDFPYIRNLSADGVRIKILNAKLILTPVKGSYYYFPLPKNLNLYNMNSSNQLLGALGGSQGLLNPTLFNDVDYNDFTRYEFDITSYIASVLQESTTDVPSLAVALSSTDLYSKLTRVIFGRNPGSNYFPKLEITYWMY